MTVKALDSLPLLVLELICELLVEHDDDDGRTDLCAFALASKTCLAAATPRRFHSIIIWPSPADRFSEYAARFGFRQQYDIRRCIELLDQYNGWRYIRRLRITHGPLTHGPLTHGPLTHGPHDLTNKDWDHQHGLDVDYFLRPLRTGNDPSDFRELLDEPNFSNLLSAFLLRATGLQDLVWVSSHIPPHIVELLATQIPRCRLHMHRFQLPSLWMPREDVPQPISDEDWALVTSPNLCTVVALHHSFDGNGNVSYLEPALKLMVGGVSPNLQHVSLKRGQIRASRGLREAARLGRPRWAGFHSNPDSGSVARRKDPQVTYSHKDAPGEAKTSRRGALRSLVFQQPLADEEMVRYGELTDLTKLSHLTLNNMKDQAPPLLAVANQARAGEFRSLTSLCLREMDSAGGGLPAMNDILENVVPLQHLCLAGFVGNDTFNIILRRHGKTLRSLHLDPYGDFLENAEHKPSELLKMTAADVQYIAESCQYLTEIEIPVSRYHGDAREVTIYRALSRLRHLKRAWLNLYYWVGPDENTSDDFPEEDMYLSNWDHDDVTLPHLKDAIADCAIDEALALSVFDIINGGAGMSNTAKSIATSQSNLQWLRLDVRRRQGRFGNPGEGSSYFDGLMELLTRDWVVERQNKSQDEAPNAVYSPRNPYSIMITELHAEKARLAADQEWKYHETWQYDSRQKFKVAFEELWQPDTSKPEWWNEWRSFPLQVSSDSMDRKDIQDGS